ncbi:AMP-binding protein [Nocardia asteroides]|uniref:AMP-binding protein n=1 Tax=Nocardia asteroides TaxID=1824 RepID=UPI001E4963E2|nr:AMP-binding protein [Nocardia asteroides]UGT61216.1 AMP-binding protein [Nocardia asteroides]
MEPDEHVATIRDWLAAPATDAGVYFAEEGDGWEYRSYAELAELSWSIAALMRERGLPGGAGVCVIMPTGFPCAAAFYAVWACGGIFTPVAPPLFGDLGQYIAHVAAILEQAQPRLVVTSVEFADLARQAHAAAGRTDEPLVVDPATLPAAGDREFSDPDECALLQFTSGSTGTPRGVRVSWPNLATNVGMISRLVDWRPGEAMVSWLPLYHDMGLVGAFLTTVTNQGDLYLMRPDQFVRDPARWLRAMTKAQHSPSPSFALGYVAHRVRAEEIAGLDLSGWRTLAVGSEPVELADLRSFAALTGPLGFSTRAYTLAYGLAESTLMVTSSARDRPITALRVDTAGLRFGAPVPVLEVAELRDGASVEGTGWITGLGFSTPESTVRVVDSAGVELPDGTLGEMTVVGGSVALGYSGPPGPASSTRIEGGVLYSGDAGFLYRGEVFVLGRMGSSLKVRGKPVFMEDIESRVAQEAGITKGKLAAVAVPDAGNQGIVLFAESAPGEWLAKAHNIIRGELGPAQTVRIVTGPRGIIQRTSSGKPRRRHMWELFRSGGIPGSEVYEPDPSVVGADGRESRAARARPGPALPAERVAGLLEAALRQVRVPEGAAVLFEGSLAEGFGNAGSDVDFLVVAAGDEELPTLPTVLFVDGRRVEIRTRSVAQLHRQLVTVAEGSALGEDVLNRCQRFLGATVVRSGAAVDLDALRALLPVDELAARLSGWWSERARQALRYAVLWRALGADAEALEWARDGVNQALKGWAARSGETYLESKWLPEQLARAGSEGRARAARVPSGVAESLAFAAELGVDGVPDDPGQLRFARRPGVTTWQIGDRVHVLRGDDVFVLADEAARAWRSVVFRRPVAAVLERGGAIGAELAEFVRLGFVGVEWRGAGVLNPALAMCDPVRPYTPVPHGAAPALGVRGAAGSGAAVTLSPLPARRFTECALRLVWSNIVLENAREDLAGAVKDGQWAVAGVAAHRMLAMAVRVLLSAFGVHPLPADVAAAVTLERLLPAAAEHRAELLGALATAQGARFDGAGDPTSALALLDDFVALVRRVAGGTDFPASFDSREQWRRTLAIGYDWLRIAGYLNTDLPLDEARDLLASGGQQPHLREGAQA